MRLSYEQQIDQLTKVNCDPRFNLFCVTFLHFKRTILSNIVRLL